MAAGAWTRLALCYVAAIASVEAYTAHIPGRQDDADHNGAAADLLAAFKFWGQPIPTATAQERLKESRYATSTGLKLMSEHLWHGELGKLTIVMHRRSIIEDVYTWCDSHEPALKRRAAGVNPEPTGSTLREKETAVEDPNFPGVAFPPGAQGVPCASCIVPTFEVLSIPWYFLSWCACRCWWGS